MLTAREDSRSATVDDLAQALQQEQQRREAAERAATQAMEVADQLQQAQLSNREIGKAIGLLMAQYRIDDSAAYEKLRHHSRDLNIKMRDLAAEIVGHHNEGCATPND